MMTKKQQTMYDSYCRANTTELWQVYNNFSSAKQRGMDYCKELQYKLDGYDGRITGHSCHFFSYAFRYMVNDEEWMCYCTHANDYNFKIS